VEELAALWGNLRVENVFQVGATSLFSIVLRWGLRLVSGGRGGVPEVRGLVDTAPLRRFLTEVYPSVDGELTGIGANIHAGRLRAIALSTSSYTTGQSITWVQGSGIREWEGPQRRSRNTTLTVEHVMASAALPLFFPAIRIGSRWYGDGGIRLAAPLSPALRLGATKILAISTRYTRSAAEADEAEVTGYPPPAQIAGVLMNAIFLDLLDHDAQRLEQMNGILEKLPVQDQKGLRRVRLLVLRPSRDLGRMAGLYEPRLPRVFRFLTRGLGTRETRSPDALSLILFQPDYLQALMECGEADARAREGEIREFIEADGFAGAAEEDEEAVEADT
jgi:NTE family protein